MKYAVVYGLAPNKAGFEETIALAKKAGYEGIELSSVPMIAGRARPIDNKEIDQLSEQAKQTASVVRKRGLEVMGFAPGAFALNYFDDVVFENYYRLAQALGSPSLKVYGTLYDPALGTYWDLFKENQRKLKAILKYGEKYCVRSLLELHFGTLNESCSAAYHIMKDFDPKLIGVIHDPQNMVIAGKETWQMGLEILGDYLAYVHWKDSCFKKDKDGVWNGELCGLNEGLVNWKEFVGALKTTGFNGYLCNEFRGDREQVPVEVYLEGELRIMKGLVES